MQVSPGVGRMRFVPPCRGKMRKEREGGRNACDWLAKWFTPMWQVGCGMPFACVVFFASMANDGETNDRNEQPFA